MTRANAIKATAGAAILGALAYLGQSGNTGFEPSTGSTAVVLTEYASSTPLLAFAFAPDATPAVAVECPSGNPTISTPDGAVTCCAVAQRKRSSMLVGYTWQCPPGWRVTAGQVVEWQP